MDGILLASFNPDSAIECWWMDKQRRPNQRKRKVYSSTSATTSHNSPEIETSESPSEDEDLLSEWDSTFNMIYCTCIPPDHLVCLSTIDFNFWMFCWAHDCVEIKFYDLLALIPGVASSSSSNNKIMCQTNFAQWPTKTRFDPTACPTKLFPFCTGHL